MCRIRSPVSVSVYCASECVSVTGLITRIQSHPSLTLRRRVIIPAVPSSAALCPRRRLSVPAAAGDMAAASSSPRTGSPRAQLSPNYYEGYLEKRGPKEKVSGSGASLWIVSVRCLKHYAQRAHGYCAYCLSMGEVMHSSAVLSITLANQATKLMWNRNNQGIDLKPAMRNASHLTWNMWHRLWQ